MINLADLRDKKEEDCWLKEGRSVVSRQTARWIASCRVDGSFACTAAAYIVLSSCFNPWRKRKALPNGRAELFLTIRNDYQTTVSMDLATFQCVQFLFKNKPLEKGQSLVIGFLETIQEWSKCLTQSIALNTSLGYGHIN